MANGQRTQEYGKIQNLKRKYISNINSLLRAKKIAVYVKF
jgi:hypothetical protein